MWFAVADDHCGRFDPGGLMERVTEGSIQKIIFRGFDKPKSNSIRIMQYHLYIRAFYADAHALKRKPKSLSFLPSTKPLFIRDDCYNPDWQAIVVLAWLHPFILLKFF